MQILSFLSTPKDRFRLRFTYDSLNAVIGISAGLGVDLPLVVYNICKKWV
jgi:hypothetical protein